MLDPTTHISLDKNTSTRDDLDFEFLKKSGIEYIESMGSAIWTDYNSHDPGITVLELLCYAITDLGNRMELPMQDLLADPDTGIDRQFHQAHEILSCRPVTVLDYRKLFIDIPGIRNCWLHKHEKKVYLNCKDNELSYESFDDLEGYDYLKDHQKKDFILNGLYDLVLDIENGYTLATLEPIIRARYHENRNLCEDLININEVKEHAVKICAEIDLYPEADEDKVKADILFAVANYFSPQITPYTLAQLLEKGYTPTAIFNGPLLENGFLDDDEVRNAQLRKEVRQSDLINIIMNVEGVRVIKDITLGACNEETPEESDWVICIESGKKPALCDLSSWSFFKGFIPLNIDETRVSAFTDELENNLALDLTAIAQASKKLKLPKANYFEIGTTTTIQNDLPEVYGVGKYGLKGKASLEEQVQAKQLKGYLLFFDQILANYFTHLDKIKELFSVSGIESDHYFAQAIHDLKDYDSLINTIDTTNNQAITEAFYPDYESINKKKRNELLDHLLARFAENFGEYAFLMKKIYGSFADEAVIKTKEGFLKNYAKSSYERSRSFNYYQQKPKNLWDTPNISALQKRLYLLLGITDINRRNLSEDYIEIYEEVDDDDIIEYRWRITDGTKTILSSATKHYHTLEDLHQELILVKKYAQDSANYKFKKIKKTDPEDPDRWHFVLINPEITDKKSEDYIIARRIASFESRANARKASKEVLNFIKTLIGNEGMYVIEHILLRPDVTKASVDRSTFLPICTEDCEGCEPEDPYSFRVSIVLPGWTERFGNMDFRRFMEDLIRKELPAHILAKICWIGYPKNYTDSEGNPPDENEMVLLETAYKAWLLSKTDLEQAQDDDALKALNKILSTLHTIYDQGYLHRCRPKDAGEIPDTDIKNTNKKIILGRTNLGKL